MKIISAQFLLIIDNISIMIIIQPYICGQNFNMRLVILFIFLSISTITLAQDGSELDRRNGFKDIKLLSDVSTLAGLDYWKAQKEKPGHDLYKRNKGAYQEIGNVKVID